MRTEEPALTELGFNLSRCGTHIDHSILTGLLPSLVRDPFSSISGPRIILSLHLLTPQYLFHPTTKEGVPLDHLEPIVIPCPDSETGLYIKTRGGETIKAVIPYVPLIFHSPSSPINLLSEASLFVFIACAEKIA